jgi:hypothetical protein
MSSTTCKTCGGSPGHHVPSMFDPNGTGYPGHKMAASKPTNTEYLSDCCKAPVELPGDGGGFSDSDVGMTMYYVCTTCKSPCDWYVPTLPPMICGNCNKSFKDYESIATHFAKEHPESVELPAEITLNVNLKDFTMGGLQYLKSALRQADVAKSHQNGNDLESVVRSMIADLEQLCSQDKEGLKQ